MTGVVKVTLVRVSTAAQPLAGVPEKVRVSAPLAPTSNTSPECGAHVTAGLVTLGLAPVVTFCQVWAWWSQRHVSSKTIGMMRS